MPLGSYESDSNSPGTATAFRCLTATSTASDTAKALAECWDSFPPEARDHASWAVASFTEDHDSGFLANTLAEHLGPDRVHGGTSCRSVMSEAGPCGDGGKALGLLLVCDPEGAYGVGSAALGDDPRAAAVAATEEALAHSGRPDETPALIWIGAAPGAEEELLRGIESVVGPGVPIAGGSSGDNEVAGNWAQIAGGVTHRDSVVISVLFPSVQVSFAFHSGYDPTDRGGRITKAEGRTIHTIDQEPAARVYDRWTNGLIAKALNGGGTILAETTMAPLGRVIGKSGGVRLFNLSHPITVEPDGSLTIFTEAHDGDEILLMEGSEENLVRRARRVAAEARDSTEQRDAAVLGGLVIFCAGCMLAVQDRMGEVVGEVRQELGGVPFLGSYTFGEQGCHVDKTNTHGNLMISIVLFRDEPAY